MKSYIEVETKIDVDMLAYCIADSGRNWEESRQNTLEFIKKLDKEHSDADFTLKVFQFFLKQAIDIVEENNSEFSNTRWEMVLAMKALLDEKV